MRILHPSNFPRMATNELTWATARNCKLIIRRYGDAKTVMTPVF
jgi:hypothetical protein